MNKICIYAICKNEIKFVNKWLDSMSEADYIVVLDTGSTDGTFELLQSDPRVTKVEQKIITPWRFDVARNESLKLVPEDANILFCTDFDELLEPGWGQLLRENWNENTWRAHYLYYWSHKPDGRPEEAFIYDKIHDKGYEWKFAVHEVLVPINGRNLQDEKEGHLLDFGNNIVLHHYPDLQKSRASYMDLLALRVEENPEEPYGRYLYGREFGVWKKYDQAIEQFKITLSLPEVENYFTVKYCVLGYLGDIYLIKEDIPEAIKYYSKQIIIDPTYREPYMNLAEIYNRLGLYSIAEQFVLEGLRKSYRHYDWAERASCWEEKPYDILSVCYYYMEEIDKGIENAVKALQYLPFDTRIQKNYLALLDKKSDLLKNNKKEDINGTNQENTIR